MNPLVHPKKLIEKTLFTLVNKKDSLMEYIRNYANKINKEREKIMLSIGVPKKLISNEILPNKYQIKLYSYLIKEYSIHS